MKIFKSFTSGFVIVIALVLTLGCAGERRNAFPHQQSFAATLPPQLSQPATVTAHVSNCSDTDFDGNPMVHCYVEFLPVGKDGKYDPRPQDYPNVRESVRADPDASGNLTVTLSPGSYEVWLLSPHFIQGETVMGIGVGAGAKLSLELNAQ